MISTEPLPGEHVGHRHAEPRRRGPRAARSPAGRGSGSTPGERRGAASTAFGDGPSGFSFDASLTTSVRPSSRLHLADRLAGLEAVEPLEVRREANRGEGALTPSSPRGPRRLRPRRGGRCRSADEPAAWRAAAPATADACRSPLRAWSPPLLGARAARSLPLRGARGRRSPGRARALRIARRAPPPRAVARGPASGRSGRAASEGRAGAFARAARPPGARLRRRSPAAAPGRRRGRPLARLPGPPARRSPRA